MRKLRPFLLPSSKNLFYIGEKFDLKIWKDPLTYHYYIQLKDNQGMEFRKFLANNFSSSYVKRIYIIPNDFIYNFFKITTEDNLIYPRCKNL